MKTLRIVTALPLCLGVRNRAACQALWIRFIWLLISAPVLAGSGWIDFVDESAGRLLGDPQYGLNDTAEKDYAWGDVDNDGDIDLVCVRKEPFTSAGRRRNVLFINEGVSEGHAVNGVLVDRTSLYATEADDGGLGFEDLTNDRDVVLTDVDGDGWLDIVTATTVSDGLPKTISHPRVYMNKGEVGGVWQGFRYEEARIPQILTIPAGDPVAPRFCSVAAGDVTGDGRPDLYFGDYDSSGAGGVPMPPGADVNNRLFINDGSGTFFDSLENNLTAEMLLSAFSMAVAIEDMNNDGVKDIVKDTALNFPQRISVAYNDPDNEGFFDELDIVYTNSPYHITIGDLNQDGWLDIVVSDDGADRYLLNQGVGPNGLATFVSFPFSFQGGSDDGFGSNSVIADLNNDGHNDVIICDVDVDLPPCVGSRRMHIYRNLGNLPNVTLQEQDGVAPWTPNGVHDVAVFDLNGDGWRDLIIGTCTGTQIWINQPPVGLAFSYPLGLPAFAPPDEALTFQVQVSGIGATTPVPGSGMLHYSMNGGSFVDVAMNHLGGDLYEATLPAASCTTRFDFYVSADSSDSGMLTDPAGAPATTYSAVSAVGTAITLRDEIEGDVSRWTIVNDPSLSTGAWEQAKPVGTIFNAQQAAPDSDATQGSSNVLAFVTQNGPPGGDAADDDVDGGPTHLISPDIDLAGGDATISWHQWFFSDAGTPDVMEVYVSNVPDDSGWVLVDTVSGTGGNWQINSFLVGDFVSPTDIMRVRFTVGDGDNSVTEAGIDNFQVNEFVCIGCIDDSNCGDGLFCNGTESCQNEVCVAGTDPCAALGLSCDETKDACVGCSIDADCDDGLFCNGEEACDAGTCVPAGGTGVENGTFDTGDGWTNNIPQDGNISYGGNLTVVGPDGGAEGYTWASQADVDLVGNNLEFDLLSYSSTDTDAWDRPVFYLDGIFYGLDNDGTLGTVVTGGNIDFGNINNSNPVAAAIHFVVDVNTIAGPGPHEIGFGVYSVDGVLGSGTAVFDNVTPASVAAAPCLGQLCDEANDACVDCLDDSDCDDGLFCNGPERCVAGSCAAATDPCVVLGLTCDEELDACTGCVADPECDDGLFCNGSERCVAGTCIPAGVGVSNGTFDGPDSWTSNTPDGGSITYPGNLNVVGHDSPGADPPSFTWASQDGVNLAGSDLEFDLLSYSSTDVDDWEYPVFYLDGDFYALNADGTLTGPTPGGTGGGGTIDNANPVTTPIHFVVDVEFLAGPGEHVIGLGVHSVDGQFGAGVSVYDEVLPIASSGDPCPGLVCDELQDQCIGCLDDTDCADGVFCNGQETCVDSNCVAGSDPCPDLTCDEAGETCFLALQPKMGDPLLGLDADQLDRFLDGLAAFDHVFTIPEGLGPVMNQNSCAACHNKGGVGGSGAIMVTRFGISEKGGFDPLEELGGSLLQAQAISDECQEMVPAEATTVTNRVTPSIFGAGLVETISDEDLLALQNSPPPGVNGVAHMVTALEDPPASPLHVGRFGWKAQVPTLLTFAADAFLNEIGITNRFLLNENDPNGINPPELVDCDIVVDPEDNAPEGEAFIDRFTDFQRFLAQPPQTPRSGMSGETLFVTIGCADCHVRGFITGTAPEAVLSYKAIHPYSDFLLHDMGLLGDGIEQGAASTTHMRTPSLWGMRVRDPLLHDGRVAGGTFAERIVAVIAEHGATGSEAEPAAAAFDNLTAPEQDAVVAFLDSLGRAEFDHDGDAAVTVADFNSLAACFTGPGLFYTPDDSCSISDIDQDGDVDFGDFDFFLQAFDGELADCNQNGDPDLLDILNGTSGDADQNGVPDECGACFPSALPEPETIPNEFGELVVSTKNRFLSFRAVDVGRSQAVRVTFLSLPPPFTSWNGFTLWAGAPKEVSENAGCVDPACAPSASTFNAARLQCTGPVFQDWEALGVVHLFHEGIVPGGTYSVQVVDETCDPKVDSSFSPPLELTQAKWGDTVENCAVTPCLPPEGVNTILDVLALVDKFVNAATAIIKARAELVNTNANIGGCVNLKTDIIDVLRTVDALMALPYPFAPSVPSDPCASTCPNPLPP